MRQYDLVFGVVASLLAVFLLLAIIATGVTAVIWKGAKMSARIVAVVVVLALWGSVAIAAAGMQGGGPSTFCQQNPNDPSCKTSGGATPQWSVLVPSTVQGTPRDALAELFDTDGGTGGGGETPTATLCAYGTNAVVDRNNKIVRITETITTTVATSAATFEAPDACNFDLAVNLQNPRDSNGDGVQDSVAFFGRVRDISATTSQDGNQTVQRNIFIFDNTFGWYMGWTRSVATQATDGQWISACPSGESDTQLPTSPHAGGCLDWVNLGTSTGAAPVYIDFAYIAHNYGFYGYTQPPTSTTYTIHIDVGTPALYNTWEVQIIHA